LELQLSKQEQPILPGLRKAGQDVRPIVRLGRFGIDHPHGGGIKVIAENGWFAARPSGTEDVYKIYAESFRSEGHLRQIQQEAQDAIACVFENAKAHTLK